MKNTFLFALLMVPGLTMANNVVVNGTFDSNTGWTGTYLEKLGGSNGFPTIDTGTYYYGKNTATNSITQVYDLTASDLSALTNSGLDYSMSADLFGYLNQGDHSIFSASFYSGTQATGNLLGTVSLDSATNAPIAWGTVFTAGGLPNYQSTTGSLSGLTRSILFTMKSIRLKGSANDGYADNLEFSMNPSAVPVPAAVWLFVSALIGLAGITNRKS